MSSSSGSKVIDDILEKVGNSSFHYKLVIFCGLLQALSGFTLLSVAVLLELSKEQEWFSSQENGFLATCPFIGVLVGGLVVGRASDYFGRRPSILFSCALFLFSSLCLLSYLSFTTICLGQFICGLAVGGTTSTIYAYVAEFFRAKERGRAIVAVSSCWMFGTVFLALVCVILLPTYSWKYLYLISALWSVSLFICFYFLFPESPRYLLVHTGLSAAFECLRECFKSSSEWSVFHDVTNYSIGFLDGAEDANFFQMIYLIFQRTSEIAWFLAVCFFSLSFGWSVVVVWTPSLFLSRNVNSIYLNNLFVALASIPGNVASFLIIDMIGSRRLLYFCLFLCSLFNLALQLLNHRVSTIVFSALFNMSVVGGWNALYAYTNEVYPTRIRTFANGLFSSFDRIGSIIANLSAFIFPGHLDSRLFISFMVLFIGCASAYGLPKDQAMQKLRDEWTDETVAFELYRPSTDHHVDAND